MSGGFVWNTFFPGFIRIPKRNTFVAKFISSPVAFAQYISNDVINHKKYLQTTYSQGTKRISNLLYCFCVIQQQKRMGMDVERFVDVNPELICSICHEVLDNPMETPCRHIYCSSCIYNWVNRSITRENNCPTCRTKVGHDSIRPALPIIKNILAKQKMHCDCFARGCKEVVTMEKMKQHLEVCPYQPIPCCHDECSALVMRKNIEKHERSCVKRKVVCPIGCGSLVVFEEAHNHGCVSILKRQLDGRNLFCYYFAFLFPFIVQFHSFNNTLSPIFPTTFLSCQSYCHPEQPILSPPPFLSLYSFPYMPFLYFPFLLSIPPSFTLFLCFINRKP